MTTRVPLEEIEVSMGEKVLAVMLAIFISIGAIWAYVRIDEVGTVAVQPTPAEQTAIKANKAANARIVLLPVSETAASALPLPAGDLCMDRRTQLPSRSTRVMVLILRNY